MFLLPFSSYILDFNSHGLNTDKFEILKKLANSRHTKDRTLKKAIITTDMSYKQREANKLLKEELKERRLAGEMNIKISKGKIVKDEGGGGGSRPIEQR